MNWHVKIHLTSVSPLLMLAWIATSTNVTCTNHCQLHDSDSECWSKARDYFINQVIKSVNEFAAVEVMIDIWQKHHDNQYVESINSTLEATLSQNEGPLTKEDILTLINLLQNKTAALSSSDKVDGVSISCPTPCDYVNTLWIYLFVCSCIVVLLTIPIVALHLYFSRKNNIKYQLSS